MDEVEAALDDVNLTRLINAFNELRAHAQLIIITPGNAPCRLPTRFTA